MSAIANEAGEHLHGGSAAGFAASAEILHAESDTTMTTPEQRHQLISAAAYRRFQERGCVPGYSLEDWLAAEHEVDAAMRQRATGSGSLEGTFENAKHVFVSTFQTLLTESQSQIEELTAKAREANTALRRKYEEQMPEINARLETARARFAEAREHSGEAWGHLREGADKAAQEMRLAIQQLAVLFKQ